MLLPIFLGLFIFTPSLQILDKDLSKKPAPFVVFSSSINLQKSFSSLKKKSWKLILKFNKSFSFLADKKYQRIQNPQEKNQSLNSLQFLKKQKEINKHKQRIKGEQKLSPYSNSAVFPLENNTNKQTAKVEDSNIEFLEKLFQEKSGLEIHNKALNFLKNNQKDQAILLLKKNLYQNFFFPSYLVLFHFEIPIFFTSFLWHISLILLAFICLSLLFLSLKKSSSFHLKLLFWCLNLSFTVFSSGFFLLKQKVSSLQEVNLRSAPFMEASINTSLKPNSDLIVLKQTKDWLRVQSLDKQSGWLQKQKVFQIF